jgi:DNA-binding PadR family transcriptional regulator
MSLRHALLGFINYGPMTGYELKKFFDTSVAHFWNAELSQIYPALKAMESDGLVEMQVDVQEDRPNRKEYSITDKGREELVEWLAQPVEPERVREPTLIKVFFGANLPKQQLIDVIQDQINQSRQYKRTLEHGCAMIPKFAEAIGLKRESLFWSLTIDAGIKIKEAEIEFGEEAIRKIENLDDSTFGANPPDWQSMDVRTATDILEKIQAALPQALSSATTQRKAASQRSLAAATQRRRT